MVFRLETVALPYLLICSYQTTTDLLSGYEILLQGCKKMRRMLLVNSGEKLCYEDFHEVYCSWNIIWLSKLRWAGHESSMGRRDLILEWKPERNRWLEILRHEKGCKTQVALA